MKDTPATILVVDDDETILEMVSLFLSSRGFDVIKTLHATKAEHLIKEYHPDIVLLDYMLSNADGLHLLREIRHKYPDTYFILFTGGGSAHIAVEAMKAGAADYISKPFKNESLLDTIKNVLKVRTVEIMNRRLLKEIEQWNKTLEKKVKEKTLELDKAYQQILQSEKNAILGFLSTGMAHDIKNPLNTINLFVQILKDDLQDDDEKLEHLNVISDNVKRVNLIIERLLESSKRPKYQIKPHNVAEIIKNTISLYEYQAFLQHIEIVPELDENIVLHADYNELEQIFSNLIINAFRAMKSGGKLTIKAKLDDENVLLSISDTGDGIKKEHLDKIFEPFFTTKKEEKGSGLGLSVVKRTVNTYGGTISVDSEVNKYTTFTIKLPVKNEQMTSQ